MKEEITDLIIDEPYTALSEEECQKLQPIIVDFIDSYEKNQDKPVEDWLTEKLATEFPERPKEETRAIAEEIVESIRVAEEKKQSLEDAKKEKGYSKEGWFAKEVKQATSAMSTQQAIQYCQALDNAVNEANSALTRTILTKAGNVSQNPSLDGYIAEMEHVQSFNMNAAAKGSPYRAKVLEHEGSVYTKNGVDIVIVDGEGHLVPGKRYQSKYCQDASHTERAFSEGDYRGQQSLVPSDQKADLSRKCTDHLEAPDGTCSEPLSKKRAQELRDEAQSGKWNDKNWNEYHAKDIAKGIGKQAGQAALLGAAIGAGTEIAEKLYHGEKIEVKEVAKKAFEGGADFGAKAAIAGAIKAGAEKGIIKCIPKGTPAGQIANVVFVAVEDAKILYKYHKGEISGRECRERIEETTVAAAGGLAAMGYGAAKGGAIGLALGGPVGAAIGGFIGGTLGYMAGSAVGQGIVKAKRKVTEVATKAVKKIAETTKTVATRTWSAVKSTAKSVCSSIGSFFGF